MIPVNGGRYRLLNPNGVTVTVIGYTPGMPHAVVDAPNAWSVPVAWLLPDDETTGPAVTS